MAPFQKAQALISPRPAPQPQPPQQQEQPKPPQLDFSRETSKKSAKGDLPIDLVVSIQKVYQAQQTRPISQNSPNPPKPASGGWAGSDSD